MNCDDSPCYPPQCNQCELSSRAQTGQMSQSNYQEACSEIQPDQCQEACVAPWSSPCYQPQQFESAQNCEPCYEQSNPCDVSYQSCNPCEPQEVCQMPRECQPRTSCPPADSCNTMCPPYSRRCYVQPPRRESCKPIVKYQRPFVPMTSDTIYKQSFNHIDSKTAALCRMPPVFPTGQLRSPCGEFAKQTVTKVRR